MPFSDILPPRGGLVLAGVLYFALGVTWAVWKCEKDRARLCLFCITSALVPLLLYSVMVFRFAVNVPYWDDYDAILKYLSLPVDTRLRHLLDFHNEHRIGFVRAIVEFAYALRGVLDFRDVIAVGNVAFLAFVGLLMWHMWHRAKTVTGRLWCVPFAWMFFSVFMFENALWALTSVSNYGVLLFAWLSLTFCEREKWSEFFCALGFAVVCTFCMGSGLFIWPSLFALMLWRFLDKQDGSRAGTGVLFLRTLFVLLLGVPMVAFYLRGMLGHEGRGGIFYCLQNAAPSLAYAMAFCGGAAHFVWLAIPLGVGICCFVLFSLYSFRKTKDRAAFSFLLFLLGSVGSATLFRSSDGVSQALSFRYRVVAVSIMYCCCLLSMERWEPRFARVLRCFCAAATLFFVVLNASAFFLAYPMLSKRSEKLVKGVRSWPATAECLCFPEERRSEAAELLNVVSRGGIWVCPR